jgi:hypothetical protein
MAEATIVTAEDHGTSYSLSTFLGSRFPPSFFSAFCESLLTDTHQSILFRDYVHLYYGKGKADLKHRILLVSNFRLIAVKLNLMGRKANLHSSSVLRLCTLACSLRSLPRLPANPPASQVRQNWSLLNLTECTIEEAPADAVGDDTASNHRVRGDVVRGSSLVGLCERRA